jgi:oxalate decarboxylase/phosphoglucose isomerase-like protein (cupin superfamily)
MQYEGGPWLKATPGKVFYVPASKVHCARNNGKSDCVFFTCKDAAAGLHGTKAA